MVDPALTALPQSVWRAFCARHAKTVTAIGFFLFIGLGVSFSVAVLVARWLTPITVTFDMTETINQYQQQMAQQFTAEHPLSDEEIAFSTQRFYQALNESLMAYQQQHHALILVSPAVVMGAEDITAEIQAAIADKMAQ
ncbi:type-F conjugative transfer system protein TrbI [Providencia alcalifaciens]|uniref:type-F conjugative transfer system protein TrbI n=1 Tax=Providencia alcalifaciens TaxID=126385 RepID=UPI001CC36A62|nr:type-F conjugative transfer system protein TrbI [Providencia alcalifaciens]CAG9436745.1 hypothetical protein NVI2019_OGMBKCAO_04077 [Providencia alcalifaciens]CAG9436839.1 hypothetical protein NVI2019_KOLGMIGM_04094 [Providencia alcalifaciens]CAG9436842.1 hypothetical protein NVI2019_PLFLNFOB_04092 [Providencia alcalifaciens]CAG9436864.1 hypothetical protein NVI2019_ANGEOOBF_04093 [Providencia alcalifaciens]CAG9437602.1 hypothetical protein NVI2019_OHEONHNH_04092 [Providencia alcalifaciens]